VINIGISRDKNDIELPDAQFFPFLKGHGEERRLPGHARKTGDRVFMQGKRMMVMGAGAGSGPG